MQAIFMSRKYKARIQPRQYRRARPTKAVDDDNIVARYGSKRSIVYSRLAGSMDSAYAFMKEFKTNQNRKSFFREGIGNLNRVSDFKQRILFEGHDSFDDIEIILNKQEGDDGNRFITIKSGRFLSPAHEYYDDEQSHVAYVEIVEPNLSVAKIKGCVILLPFTSDTTFSWRRNNLAIPLAMQGYVSILLLPPMCGKRASVENFYSASIESTILHNYGTMVEAGKLIQWARKHYPCGTPIGIAGVSIGAFTAVGGSLWIDDGDIAVIPVLLPLSGWCYFKSYMGKEVNPTVIEQAGGFKIFDELIHELAHLNMSKDAENLKLPRRIILRQVSAKDDKVCIPSESAKAFEILRDFVNDSMITWKNGGHLSVILKGSDSVVATIVKSLEKLRQYKGSGVSAEKEIIHKRV